MYEAFRRFAHRDSISVGAPRAFALALAIRAVEQARNELVDMEDLSDEELHRLQRQFELLRKSAEQARASRDLVAGRGV
ncbi:MAG TPA: low affinity iron permease family protein [Gemmatimonadaceae bacterium]|nr:low affinity iron permease family protein [Gemmatimonadaceae bacterium]